MTSLIETILPLNEQMRCGIFTNPAGESLIIYDRKIPGEFEWVEYDENGRTLSLIDTDGNLFNLGLNVTDDMAKNLKNGKSIALALIQDQKIISSQKIVLVTQDYK